MMNIPKALDACHNGEYVSWLPSGVLDYFSVNIHVQ